MNVYYSWQDYKPSYAFIIDLYETEILPIANYGELEELEWGTSGNRLICDNRMCHMWKGELKVLREIQEAAGIIKSKPNILQKWKILGLWK